MSAYPTPYRCLDWQRDDDLERVYNCCECGTKVLTEFVTHVVECDQCEGTRWSVYHGYECTHCYRGYIGYGGVTTELHDSRSMLTHDGRWKCGDCVCGTHKEARHAKNWNAQPAYSTFLFINGESRGIRNSPHAMTLEQASKAVGKRTGYMTKVAIMEVPND